MLLLVPVQKKMPLPHGMTFGQKVDPLQKMPSAKLETFMGKMIRISTTITGKVIAVDTPKGGWFRMDGGNKKIIEVHFKDYNITLPKELRGRNVMIQGIAQKQFITGDNKTNLKGKLTFEASGLMVE